MRLARFRSPDGRPLFGVAIGDHIVALDHGVASFEALVAAPEAASPCADDPRWDPTALTWEPPVGTHAKIFCVGYNYAAHAQETERELPTRPTLFTRYPDSLVGSGQPVVRPPESDSLDWEGEVALVIGAPARRVPVAAAEQHIAGFTCLAENSVREWQQHSTQATAGKNWQASGACGPWVVMRNEAGQGPFELTTRLNGELVQQDNTDHLVFSFAELISYIGTFTPLRPGDMIATGTPAGVGFRRDPPRYLQPGDELTVEVPGIGALRNTVFDETSLDHRSPHAVSSPEGLSSPP